MPDEVKRRPYRSDRRQLQARATRRAVVDATQARFVRDGYAATTLQQIADDAGVSVQTIYATFRTKRQLLAEVLDVAIAGDDEPVSIKDRDWMQTALHDGDVRIRLEAYAAAVCRIVAGAGDMFTVVRDAASIDPDLAEMAATADARRRAGATAVVRGIAGLGALRAPLDEHTATDILWTLNSPELFHLLVRRCDWSLDRYRQWLATTMCQQLLHESAPSGGSAG